MAVSSGSTGSSNAGDGITGGYTGNSLALRIIIGCFTAIAWYNAVELNILILVTFKKYKGLYFWSLPRRNLGVIFYGIGFLFKFFQIIDSGIVNVVFITVGWWCMVTGQSVVLYSRLHLIVLNRKLLRRILWMIIIDAVVLHIPTTVLTFGSNVSNPHTQPAFVRGYNVMEKIQMTGFCLQEFIISGIYLSECIKFLKTDNQRKSRRTLYELVYINTIIIAMDLSLLGLEYANFYILEIVIKGMVYSVKLKLEFAILGKLVQYVKTPSGDIFVTGATEALESDMSEFVNPSQTSPEVFHIPTTSGSVFKRESTSAANGGLSGSAQHIETRGVGGEAKAVVATSHYESIHPSAQNHNENEDDLETLMKRYSVG